MHRIHRVVPLAFLLLSSAASAQSPAFRPRTLSEPVPGQRSVQQGTTTPDLRYAAIVEAPSHDLVIWEILPGGPPRVVRTIPEVWPSRRGLAGLRKGPALRPDGAQVAYGGMDGFARVWDVATGRLLHKLPHSIARGLVRPDTARVVSFDPTGRFLASVGDQVVSVWDLTTGTLRWTSRRGHTDWPPIYDAAFSPAGDVLATVADSGGVQLWSARSGERLGALPTPQRLTNLRFSADGSRIIVTYTRNRDWRTYTYLQVWSLGTSELVRELTWPGIERGLAISPDGRMVLGGSDSLSIWDVATGKEIAVQPHAASTRNRSYPTEVAEWSADGSRLLTVDQLRGVTLWEVAP
jgi:WD40 repeat protein